MQPTTVTNKHMNITVAWYWRPFIILPKKWNTFQWQVPNPFFSEKDGNINMKEQYIHDLERYEKYNQVPCLLQPINCSHPLIHCSSTKAWNIP
jgi:hypothetical protein